MTEITRESLIALVADLDNGKQVPSRREIRLMAFALRRVMELHRPDPRHGGLLCEDDDQEWPCRTAYALAGTQTDDGAGEKSSDLHGDKAPSAAPSSPDRIDALAAENARLRAQVQDVEALCDPHGDYQRFMVPVVDLRTALATTEAGEES